MPVAVLEKARQQVAVNGGEQLLNTSTAFRRAKACERKVQLAQWEYVKAGESWFKHS